MKLPFKIGDTLYSVQEHRYYDKSISPAPLFEYIVVQGKVVRFLDVGRYKEVVIHAKVDHFLQEYYYKISDFEKCYFLNYEDAVKLAIRATENYERIWGWCKNVKLRRSWEQDVNTLEPVQMNLCDFGMEVSYDQGRNIEDSQANPV